MFAKMEYRYPQHTLVAVEEEPRILYWVEISYNMQFACWRIALGTHNGNFFAVAAFQGLLVLEYHHTMPHAIIPTKTNTPVTLNTFFMSFFFLCKIKMEYLNGRNIV